MEKITVEQLYKSPTYRQPESTVAAATNLSGFAFSFEDLLQRVGARVNQAFSAADKSSGIMAVSNDVRRDAAPRETARETERRNEPSENRARPSDDNFADTNARSPVGHDADRIDASSDVQSSDTGAVERTSRNADGNNEGGHQANNSDRENASSDAAGDDGQSGNDADANNSTTNNGNADGKNTDGQATAANASDNAPQNAAAAGQAAALYAAGVVGGVASENAKSGNTQQGQQGQVATEAAQGVTAQVAAGAAAKAQQTSRANNHQGAANNQTGQQQAAAAKAGEMQQQTKPDTVQDQAQRLAGMLNKNTRAEINVSVNSEQNQLTSKPTTTLTNGSIIAKDAGANNAGSDNQQNGQRPGANAGQMTQQMQLAANQQQAQAAQQQAATQGGAKGGPTQISGAQTGAQASGGAAHNAGGADAMNNTQSNAGAPQTQQTQQIRDAQPQQQAQQAQRSNLPGATVADQISVKITKALQAGTDRISIQLRPAELGRVDVKMEITHDGRVMTVVTAEKQDTLDLLRRDSSELQRALAEAGLQSGDMEFNLKGQDKQTAEGENGDGNANPNVKADAEEQLSQNDDGVMNAWESGIFMNGRIDMRA